MSARARPVALSIAGLLILCALWEAVARLGWVSAGVLPPLSLVLKSFVSDLGMLVEAGWRSVLRTGAGYAVALAVAVPLGLLFGRIRVLRDLFGVWMGTARFLPLAALVGLFIAALGIGETMKVSFLAFGVGVYLVPTVMQRVAEVPQDLKSAMMCLGASPLRVFREVEWPSVRERLVQDIRILTPIAWTYIVLAEMLHGTGGLGRLAFHAARYDTPLVYATLLAIIGLALVQDALLRLLDRGVNPHLYA